MDKALSLKYGQLVNSNDVSYDAYKEYLLVCPHCKEPVYLVAGSHRKEHTRIAPKSRQLVTVKEAEVTAAFSHYNKSSKCELVTSSLSQKNIFRMSAIAKGQRKKYFEDNFLDLMRYNKRSMKNIVFNTLSKVLEQHEQPQDNKKIKGCLKLMKNGFMKFFREAKYLPSLHREKLYLISVSEDPLEHFELFNSDQETIQKFNQWAKTFDLELQYKLCDEVFDFLSTNTAQSLGYEILDLSFYRYIIRSDLKHLASVIAEVPMTEGMVNIVDKCIQEFTENIAFTDFNFSD